LSLVLSAATADAQGKYLLWSYFTLRDGEYWQVNYAFESKKECKAVAAAVLREAARRGNTVTVDRITTASGDLTPICLRDTVDPRGPKSEVTDAHLWHPWLRINRVLRVILQTRWSVEAWLVVRVEFRRALALRSEIRSTGRYRHGRRSRPSRATALSEWVRGVVRSDRTGLRRLLRQGRNEPVDS